MNGEVKVKPKLQLQIGLCQSGRWLCCVPCYIGHQLTTSSITIPIIPTHLMVLAIEVIQSPNYIFTLNSVDC